ncbi:hypothetical protein AVL59_00280 [Streptomyces griseochromogenes]|uniref:Uncharacterized protein n=1 Tax=Streptomyces griseochromogenes TaxID=68214 RepID=A0A1B1ANW9_9ACTN|nr:hypothetical protein AVL59_00280 [Streptomyces griseochromogenes]
MAAYLSRSAGGALAAGETDLVRSFRNRLRQKLTDRRLRGVAASRRQQVAPGFTGSRSMR